MLTCDQAFFFGAVEKGEKKELSVFQAADSRVAIHSRFSEKRTPDRRLLTCTYVKYKRVLMGLTVNRQIVKTLTANSQK